MKQISPIARVQVRHLLVTGAASFLLALAWLIGSGTTAHAATDCSIVSEIPQSECLILVTLYTTTDGPNWKYQRDWYQTSTPCDWEGVTCDQGHVVGLELSANEMEGSIPPELGGLTHLTELSLGSNQFSGAIPPELG
ncbi:MAG: hypothetical protein HC884_17570 [Chloroflexaceae bacterium]|nr:hypothetical protein [Chloroflexaceae bacterium]